MEQNPGDNMLGLSGQDWGKRKKKSAFTVRVSSLGSGFSMLWDLTALVAAEKLLLLLGKKRQQTSSPHGVVVVFGWRGVHCFFP